MLAASSLNYRFWTGCLSYYDNAETRPAVDNRAVTTQVECGVSDVKWIPGSRRFVAACDSGNCFG